MALNPTCGWPGRARPPFSMLSHLTFLVLFLLLPLVWPAAASAAAATIPTYTFVYPRSVSYSEFVNEPLLSNGSLTAFLMNQGTDSFYPSQLKKILAPPFLLNNDQTVTLFTWGFDEQGYHAVQNRDFSLRYSLDGMHTHVDQINYVMDSMPQTNAFWQVDIDYHTVPESRTMLVTYTYKNQDSVTHALRFAAGLSRPQVRRTLDWAWDNPQGGIVDAHFDATLGHGAIATSSVDKDAFLVFGLDQSADSHAVTATNEYQLWTQGGRFSNADAISHLAAHQQYLSHDFGRVAPGASVQISIVLSIADSQAAARQDFLAAIADPQAVAAAGRSYWEAKWQATHFAVATPDPALDRMSDLAMMTGLLAWDRLNQSWITGFGHNARGIVYRWDTYYASKGFYLSDPVLAKATIRRHLAANWRQHYAYRLVDHASVGDYYAYNHMAITNMVYQYIALTGDAAFLGETVGDSTGGDPGDAETSGKSVLQILVDECGFIDSVLHYDFGENHNLLEVVPRYVHEVPDLTASTYDMANKIGALAHLSGDEANAAVMARIAATALAKTQALWNPQLRWFQTGSGSVVYTTQVLDMITTGALSSAQVDGLLARSKDFIFAYGTRSLASYDENYNVNTRGDWDGPAAYIGVPGNVLDDLAYARRREQLYALSKGIAQWWQWRPVTAQGIEATSGKIVGSIGLSTLSTAARYAEVVPFQLVGLRYRLGGLDLFDNVPAGWSNAHGNAVLGTQRYAAMVRVPFRGKVYNLYIDKPEATAASFAAASIVDGDGAGPAKAGDAAAQDSLWWAQRLPLAPGPEMNLVLHFAAGASAVVQDIDELTEVRAASASGLDLANNHGTVAFRLDGATRLGHYPITLAGLPNHIYTLMVDGTKRASAQADALGLVRFAYDQQAATGGHQVQLVPTTP